MKRKSRIGDTVAFEVTEEDYRAALAKGISPDEMMSPGKHYGVRGGGLLHRDITPEEWKQISAGKKSRLTLMLDADIVEYFKARASQPDSASVEAQINDALRAVMEREQPPVSSASRAALLGDEEFIRAVAEQVKARLQPRRGRKAA
jgi:hypothetical protein